MNMFLQKTLLIFITTAALAGCNWKQEPFNMQGRTFTLNASNTDPVLMEFRKTLHAYQHGTNTGPKATFSHDIKTQTIALSPDGQDRVERLQITARLVVEGHPPISTTLYQDRLVNQNQKLADDAEVTLIKAELAHKAILQLLREMQHVGI